MTSKKTEDTIRHLTRWLREIGNNTADLTVVREECIARHPIDFGCRALIGEGQLTIRPSIPFASKQIDPVGFGRVPIGHACGAYCEAPVDTLRAKPAAGMRPGHVAHTRAAAGVTDEIPEPMRGDSLDDLGLGAPHERISDTERTLEKSRELVTEARQDLRRRGASGPRPNDLGEERQVHAHDAIFKEAEAIEAEQPRGGRTQGSK